MSWSQAGIGLVLLTLTAETVSVGSARNSTTQAPAPSAAVMEAVAGRVAGKPVNCITASRVSGPDVVDQYNIVYRETRRRVWLNRLSDKCPLVRDNDIMVVERFGDQLCRYDRFRLVNRNSGLGSAYCILGTFTPYDLPNPAR